jgi:predicted transglutaminase-like cysteine proteinase
VFEPDTLHLTKDIYALLVSVNLAVNRTLTPMTDKHHYGIADLWGYTGDGLGDCEDYQLLKRKLLINAKLPRRALLMTVVIDESGEGHAVLTVRTDRGDLILDNKVNTVREWFEMNYTFVKRESAHKIGWVYLVAEPASAMIASLEK